VEIPTWRLLSERFKNAKNIRESYGGTHKDKSGFKPKEFLEKL
jgi:hypothetical protein